MVPETDSQSGCDRCGHTETEVGTISTARDGRPAVRVDGHVGAVTTPGTARSEFAAARRAFLDA
jgi:hypothetical protein